MANIVTKTFMGNGTFTPPAGVTSVNVQVTSPTANPSGSNGSGFLIDSYGNGFGWGVNADGSLGNSGSANTSSPVAVVGGLNFKSLVCQSAGQTSFGLTNSGTLYAWGLGTSGVLGTNAITTISSPVLVVGGLTFQSVYTDGGSNYTLGLTTAGAAYAWGANTSGQLGDGTISSRSSPVAVLGGLTFQSLSIGASGNNTVFGLTTAGAAYAWGANTSGQLGDGTISSRSSPVAVLGGLTFQSLIAGEAGVGLTTAGAAYAWGDNTNGQLGDGTITKRSSPVAVLGGLTFQAIYTDGYPNTVLGLTTLGAIYAWGLNNAGELGDGTISSRSSPVAVLGGLTFQSAMLSNGSGITACGLTTSGALYSWGDNTNGQLGDGTITKRSSPVAVLGGLTFQSIIPTVLGSGGSVQYGLATSGQLYAWGANFFGGVGDGTVIHRSSPVLVIGGLLAGPQSKLSQRTIAVVPGQAYSITFGSYYAMLGSVPVDTGGSPGKVMTITYEQ